MKLLTLLLFSMVLIVGCVPGPPDRNFIRYMDTLTNSEVPYYRFSRHSSKIDDIGRIEDIIKEEEKNGLRTIWYKRPGNLSMASSKYHDEFCYFHIVVNIETEKIISWGFDMPDGKLRRNVCSTFG